MKVPTDCEILDAIYKRYYKAFAAFSAESPERLTKIYVPIDIRAIAEALDVDGDIVFGRLYYHLENKYGYQNTDGSRVPFFSLKVGNDPHCVNFPLLGSVLAGLREERTKNRWAVGLAILSLVVAVVSLFVSMA